MKKTHIGTSIIFLVVIVLMLLLAGIRAGGVDGNQNAPNAVSKKGGDGEAPTRPMIIWFHTVETDPNILDLAISNGIFSHVMLAGLHSYDRPDYFANPNLKKALTLCKEKGVKVIWCRWLYPGYKFRDFRFDTAFEARYYVQRIREIKEEAKRMGADLVALDAEPYGMSPLRPLKLPNTSKLTPAQYDALNDAIQTSIRIAGKVDFVLPAASPYRRHLYNATPALGKSVISVHTYRDIPWKLKDKRRAFHIFGAYVSTKKTYPDNPHGPGPYFTPREILEKQVLWIQKDGLFVFPGPQKDIGAIALEFSRIKTIRPAKDSNDVH